MEYRMNGSTRNLAIRLNSFIVALSLTMICLGVVSDGLTLQSIGAQSALTVAFIAVLLMVLRIEPRETATANSKRRSGTDRLLCGVAFCSAIISLWLTFAYSSLRTAQALPYVLVLASLPICLVLAVRWYKLNKHEPPAV